jgi:hypothetical protein
MVDVLTTGHDHDTGEYCSSISIAPRLDCLYRPYILAASNVACFLSVFIRMLQRAIKLPPAKAPASLICDRCPLYEWILLNIVMAES